MTTISTFSVFVGSESVRVRYSTDEATFPVLVDLSGDDDWRGIGKQSAEARSDRDAARLALEWLEEDYWRDPSDDRDDEEILEEILDSILEEEPDPAEALEEIGAVELPPDSGQFYFAVRDDEPSLGWRVIDREDAEKLTAYLAASRNAADRADRARQWRARSGGGHTTVRAAELAADHLDAIWCPEGERKYFAFRDPYLEESREWMTVSPRQMGLLGAMLHAGIEDAYGEWIDRDDVFPRRVADGAIVRRGR